MPVVGTWSIAFTHVPRHASLLLGELAPSWGAWVSPGAWVGAGYRPSCLMVNGPQRSWGKAGHMGLAPGLGSCLDRCQQALGYRWVTGVG